METGTAHDCPQCGAALVGGGGWVRWCAACEWNLQAPEPPVARTRVQRAYVAAGTRLGTRLAAELAAEQEALEPRLTPAKALAFAIALVVHVVTVVLAASGVLLAVRASGNVFAYVIAAVMVGAASLMRPRTSDVPLEDRLPRERAPELHALIDEVAGALGTPAPDVVIVDDAHNAFWTVAGLRRRRVLGLGLPLFFPLDPQERVALIAHELGHASNGDSGRGLIVGSALRALAALYELVAPGSRLLVRTWEVSLAEPLANAFMWVVSPARVVAASAPGAPALARPPACRVPRRRTCRARRRHGRGRRPARESALRVGPPRCRAPSDASRRP